MKFAVVKFIKEDDAIGVIPLSWVKKGSEECLMSYYPPPSIKNIQRLVKKKVTPRIDWDFVEIKIIHEYQTYEDARKKLPKAEDTSNLSSDEGEERKKRKRKPKNLSFPGEELREYFEEDSNEDSVHPVKQTSLPSYPSLPTFSSKPAPSSSDFHFQELPIFTAQEVLNDINYTPPVTGCSFTPLARPLFLTSPTPSKESTIMSLTSPTPAIEQTIMTPNHHPITTTHQSKSGCTESKQQQTPRPATNSLLPSTSECNNENCNRLFVVIGQLQETVADLSDQVKRLNDKMDNHFTTNTLEREDEKSYEVLGKIPVQSLEEMEELEKTLETPQFKKQLFKVLTSIGGKDVKTMGYNCLRRLMCYSIAEKYSYSGNTARNKEKTKKMAFSKTNACKIAHQAVKKVYPAATEEVVKSYMGKWLQQAKYRLGRKCSEVGGVPEDDRNEGEEV